MTAPVGSGSRRRRPIRRTSTAARSAMRSSAWPGPVVDGHECATSRQRRTKRPTPPCAGGRPRSASTGCRTSPAEMPSSMPIEHPAELAPQSALTRPSTRTKSSPGSGCVTSADGRATRITPARGELPDVPRLSVVDREDQPAGGRAIPVGWRIGRGEDRRPRVAGQPARPAACRTRGAGHSFGDSMRPWTITSCPSSRGVAPPSCSGSIGIFTPRSPVDGSSVVAVGDVVSGGLGSGRAGTGTAAGPRRPTIRPSGSTPDPSIRTRYVPSRGLIPRSPPVGFGAKA